MNWELYQSNDLEPTNKPASNRQATDKQPTTNKNDKELKEVKKDPSVAEISSNYQKYLNDHNIGRQQRLLEYLDEGIDPDVVNEAIRDSVTADDPVKYVFGILDKCKSEKVTSLQQYIDRKIEHDKRRKAAFKTEKPKDYANFEQRAYSEDDYDSYFANVKPKE